MPDDPIERFLIRFEGGPIDGRESGSTIIDPEALPAVMRVGDALYELASHSQLPPTPGVIRGALYRYRGPAPARTPDGG